MDLNDLHDAENEEKTLNVTEISQIYSSTFSLVGLEFMDALMREITIQTKVDSAVLLQLLTADEYKDITEVYKDDEFHLISSSSLSSSSSPEIHHTFADDLFLKTPSLQQSIDSISDILQDKFLLIRSCFSNQASK